MLTTFYSKVPPSVERRGQRTESHVICKAPEGEQRFSFRHLANHMTFNFLRSTGLYFLSPFIYNFVQKIKQDIGLRLLLRLV